MLGFKKNNYDNYLWELLKEHVGHEVKIVAYGDPENPGCIVLECEECGEVVVDASMYTLQAREKFA